MYDYHYRSLYIYYCYRCLYTLLLPLLFLYNLYIMAIAVSICYCYRCLYIIIIVVSNTFDSPLCIHAILTSSGVRSTPKRGEKFVMPSDVVSINRETLATTTGSGRLLFDASAAFWAGLEAGAMSVCFFVFLALCSVTLERQCGELMPLCGELMPQNIGHLFPRLF